MTLPLWRSTEGCLLPAIKVHGIWLATGAPLGPEITSLAAMDEFLSLAGPSVFFGVTEAQASHLANRGAWTFKLGSEPVWKLNAWQETARSSRSIEGQIKRAQRKGVIGLAGPVHLQDAAEVLRSWQADQPLRVQGFAASPLDVSHSEVVTASASVDGRLVGYAAAVQRGPGSWVVHDLIRKPDAPNGTNELLVSSLFEHFYDIGAEEASLGLTPLAGCTGLKIQALRRIAGPLYHFSGIEGFRQKLKPTEWRPLWLAGCGDVSQVRAAAALGKALIEPAADRS